MRIFYLFLFPTQNFKCTRRWSRPSGIRWSYLPITNVKPQCLKYNLCGPSDHPLLGGNSGCPQHELWDPICLAQPIQSGPASEPSSIFGHSAVRIHKFQEYLCHPFGVDQHCINVTPHHCWSTQAFAIWKYQLQHPIHWSNFVVRPPGRRPKKKKGKIGKEHVPNWNVMNTAGRNIHESLSLTYVNQWPPNNIWCPLWSTFTYSCCIVNFPFRQKVESCIYAVKFLPP